MLKLIKLKRFKKFQNMEVHLRPFTVLMGENSSGKTTILQAINSAMILLTGSGLVTGTNEKIKIRNTGAPMFALPGVILEDSKGLFYGNVPRGGKAKGASGIGIGLIDDNNNSYEITINYLFGGLNVKCTSKAKELSNNPTLHLKLPLLISGFVGLLPSEERSYSVALGEKLRSGQVSAIIRNILLDTKMKKPESFAKLQERLAKDFNFYLDNVSFDEQKDVHITAKYKEASSSTKGFLLDINSSGSGFLQILQILAPIYRFCPDDSSIVLLDEPDAHLHPNLQASLALALREIQKELNIQIIISTHSTSIIRSADPSEVVPVSSKLRSIQPLTHSEDVERQIVAYIDSYELGKSVISGKLVFLEDQDTSIIEAFDRILKTNCFSGTNTVPVLKGRSKDDKFPFELNKMLKDLEFIDNNLEIHFVRDGDGLDVEWREKISEFAVKGNVIVHHLERHEIENYLLCPDLIRRSLCRKHPDKVIPSVDALKRKIFDLLKDTIQFARYGFVDVVDDNIYKTAQLLKIDLYKNPKESKSKAKKLVSSYEELNKFEELLNVGMGKEALKGLLSWLNDSEKLNLSRSDLINNLEIDDIPEEIKIILGQLKSRDIRPSAEIISEIEDAYEEESIEQFSLLDN